MNHPIFDHVDFRCLKCGAAMGTCHCWWVAQLVKTEEGWEARLDSSDGRSPNVWKYKRLYAAKRKIAEWRDKGYRVEGEA